MDKGSNGKNYLSISKIAEEAVKPIHFADSKESKLICYCVMPNHIHLVFRLLQNNSGISKITLSIKRISSRRCNELLKTKGKFWQAESFDRLLRDNKELFHIINYIVDNPVNAGLVNDFREWKYTYVCKDFL